MTKYVVSFAIFVVIALAVETDVMDGVMDGIWLLLGYGWIPVCLWLTALLLSWKWQPAAVRVNRRLLASGAVLTLATIIALSHVYPFYGPLFDVGYAGKWGRALGGGSFFPSGFLRLAAIAVLAPPVLYPKETLPYYRLAWVYTRRGIRIAARKVAAFRASDARALWQGLTTRPTPSQRATGTQPASPRAASSNGSASSQAPPPHPWQRPPADLLSPSRPPSVATAELERMARVLKETLADHYLDVEVAETQSGPRIARFGLTPGWVRGNGQRRRVTVQNILARERDLALALNAQHLNVEAQLPGAGLIGVEIPSPSPSPVLLRDVLDSGEYHRVSAGGYLPIAIGRNVSGTPVALDLAELPHLLVAGATGSGKSVLVNAIVSSLIFSRTPDDLQLALIDPKRVELTPFNGVPHLALPVTVEPGDAVSVLRELNEEMDRRYKALGKAGARNIQAYNRRGGGRLKYLVLVVDEVADLLLSAGKEAENNLARLAQTGRAVGIHMVVATQRTTVNVITGRLKANIPGRMAFAVASSADSHVILDRPGAEKLLGRGDGLLLQKDSFHPERVQGALVDDADADALADFWRRQRGAPIP